MTHWAAVCSGVVAIEVTVRALVFGFVDVRIPAFVVMLAGYVAIVALRILSPLPVSRPGGLAVWRVFVSAASAVLLRGLAPAPVLLLGLSVLIAALFLGRAGMVASLLLVGATVALFGHPEPVDTFSAWSSAIDVVCVAGVLTIIVQFVVSRLERSLDERSTALERLRAEQALRERTQDDLTRAHATLQQRRSSTPLAGWRVCGPDFNNTLQVVLGWTELLRDETQPQQMQDGIEQIRSAAERSRGLTRRLLTFSRPELSAPTHVELHGFLPSLVRRPGAFCRTTSHSSCTRIRTSGSSWMKGT